MAAIAQGAEGKVLAVCRNDRDLWVRKVRPQLSSLPSVSSSGHRYPGHVCVSGPGTS